MLNKIRYSFWLCLVLFDVNASEIDTTNVLKAVYQNVLIKKSYNEKNSFGKIMYWQKKGSQLIISIKIETNEEYNLKNIKEIAEYSGGLTNNIFVLNGEYKIESYYPRNAKQQGKIVNNYVEGLVINYSDGKISSKYNYKKGLINGIVTSYYDNEKVQAVYNYKNDTLDGDYYYFYNNDQLREKGSYCKGNFCGLYKEYYKSGAIKTKGKYSGKQIFSFKCDTCKKYIFLREGNKIDMFKTYTLDFRKEFFEDFNVNQSNKYRYPLKEGEWIYYSEDGNTISRKKYNKIGDLLL
jgi:antitoxin component YwqK of YwqJK toxin-antitoxin module